MSGDCVLYHVACIKCSSSDALDVYYDEGENNLNGYCWSCEKYVNEKDLEESEYWNELQDYKNNEEEVVTDKEEKPKTPPKRKNKKDPITEEEHNTLKAKTGYVAYNYRGIMDKYNKFYGHLTELDEQGNVRATYYPETECSELVGYKCRNHPKDFSHGKVGRTGKGSDLSGQFRFKGPRKYTLLCGGEADKTAAFQILREDQIRRGKEAHPPVAVVSPTTGENCVDQVRANYDWFDESEVIVLGLDNDEAGQKATKELLKVLPKDKVRLAKWSMKDPNEMLLAGKSQEFVREFYSALPASMSGIVSAADLKKEIIERAKIPKIPLPPFMHKLEDKLAGGLPLGYIVNILSGSGTGKTTLINEMVYYWAKHSPHLCGIVSLEASAGEYGTYLLSRHLGRKIELIKDQNEKIAYLESEDVVQKEKSLWWREDGSPAFYLMDDRGELDTIRRTIETMVRKLGVKLIVLDPIQDVLDTMSLEDQADFMSWQKKLVQSDGVSIININHARKNSKGQKANSQGADLSEEDMQGNSAIYKSGGINIVVTRDKEAEDEVERNTTRCKVTKSRGIGFTGWVGEFYYDNQTHTLHDREDFFKEETLNEEQPQF